MPPKTGSDAAKSPEMSVSSPEDSRDGDASSVDPREHQAGDSGLASNADGKGSKDKKNASKLSPGAAGSSQGQPGQVCR
jgi:hypothetical protein